MPVQTYYQSYFSLLILHRLQEIYFFKISPPTERARKTNQNRLCLIFVVIYDGVTVKMEKGDTDLLSARER